MNAVSDFIAIVFSLLVGILALLQRRKLKKLEGQKHAASLFLILACSFFLYGILVLLDRQFHAVWPVARVMFVLKTFDGGLAAGVYLALCVLGYIKTKW